MRPPEQQLPEQPAKTAKPMARRRFLLWSATAAATTAIAAACRDLITSPSPSPSPSSSRVPDTLSAPPSSALKGDRLAAFLKYPAPAYVTPGYVLLLEQDDRPDGFRGAQGFGEEILQVALLFRGPSAPRSSVTGPVQFPLLFFATHHHGYQLAGTEAVTGVKHLLRFDDGSSTVATYHDGMWAVPRLHAASGKRIAPPPNVQREWPTDHWHSLTYRWQDYTIGIRGSRLCQVTFDELTRIARSTSVLT